MAGAPLYDGQMAVIRACKSQIVCASKRMYVHRMCGTLSRVCADLGNSYVQLFEANFDVQALIPSMCGGRLAVCAVCADDFENVCAAQITIQTRKTTSAERLVCAADTRAYV